MAASAIEVSPATYAELYRALRQAGHAHAIDAAGRLDLSGIFIVEHAPDFERLRCPRCRSSNATVDGEVGYRCNHCGFLFKEGDIGKDFDRRAGR